MRYINFKWNLDKSMVSILSRQIKRVGVGLDVHNRPNSVLLIYDDCPAVKVTSEMVDLGDRIEVNRLVFEFVENCDENLDFYNGSELCRINGAVKKLCLIESDCIIECGLLIENGLSDFLILGGVFPYSLALSSRVIQNNWKFETAYPLADYLIKPV